MKYTKKQIEKSIAYWQNVLDNISESKSVILKKLSDKVGNDMLFSANMNFIPYDDIMNDLFDILNIYLFNRNLPKIDVKCLTTNNIQNIFKQHNHFRDASTLYAVYFPVVDWSKITHAKTCQTPNIHYLMLNIDNFPMSFSFAICALCHEMIHYLDTIKGDVLLRFKLASLTRKVENEHLTPLFMKKTNDINKTGLSIFPDDGTYSPKDLSDLCAYRIKKLEEVEHDLISGDNSNFKPIAMLNANIDEDGNIIAISF